MRLESSSRSFQMTARKTSISPDFPFRNTIRYFDSDQMLEESKSLSKRKLQVEHSGGRESKVQRKQTQKRNKLQTSYQTNTSPLLFFVLFVSFLLKYARTSEGSAPASRAGALANRVRSARFALAKRAQSARAVFIRWWVGYFAGSAIRRLEDVVGRRLLHRARESGWVSILRAHPASAKCRGAAGGGGFHNCPWRL